MIHAKRVAFGAFLLLAVSAATHAQDREGRRGPGAGAIEAARDTLGLTDEQIDSIGEIRRARPPRGQNREESRAWRDDQRAKLQDVLTDDQKSKLAELQEQRQTMQALAGAAILGLAEMERQRPGPGRPGSRLRRRPFAIRARARMEPPGPRPIQPRLRSPGRPFWARGRLRQGPVAGPAESRRARLEPRLSRQTSPGPLRCGGPPGPYLHLCSTGRSLGAALPASG